jgi:ABC-type phosphate/phosphonate transport system substrate-binding protein
MRAGRSQNRALTPFRYWLSYLGLVAACASYLPAGSDLPTRLNAPPLRVAVSGRVVTGVNLNDARAAMSIWTRELLHSIGLEPVPHDNWVMESDQLLASIRGGTMDLFCITVREYRQVTPYVDTSRIITDDEGGDELLLVVRERSGGASLADLRGRSLIQWDSPRTTLAEPWLTVALLREGLGPPPQFLGRMTTNPKLSQVVLRVFFGQADACVVTRGGLDTMIELNPQLARQLKVILASPRMRSVFLAFHKDYPANLKEPIFKRMFDLNSSPTAKQVLVLFQSSGFTVQDGSCLSNANSLLDAYERHRPPAAGRKR